LQIKMVNNIILDDLSIETEKYVVALGQEGISDSVPLQTGRLKTNASTFRGKQIVSTASAIAS
jgi:hypothetical protein